jgi:hypothetical protein
LHDGFSQTSQRVASNKIGTNLAVTDGPFCGFNAGEFNELMVVIL